jgi:hypothetical protein
MCRVHPLFHAQFHKTLSQTELKIFVFSALYTNDLPFRFRIVRYASWNYRDYAPVRTGVLSRADCKRVYCGWKHAPNNPGECLSCDELVAIWECYSV